MKKYFNGFYFLIFTISALLIAWYAWGKIRPTLIESSCSDIAQRSSGLYYKNRQTLDPQYTYDNLKARCLDDINYLGSK